MYLNFNRSGMGDDCLTCTGFSTGGKTGLSVKTSKEAGPTPRKTTPKLITKNFISSSRSTEGLHFLGKRGKKEMERVLTLMPRFPVLTGAGRAGGSVEVHTRISRGKTDNLVKLYLTAPTLCYHICDLVLFFLVISPKFKYPNRSTRFQS